VTALRRVRKLCPKSTLPHQRCPMVLRHSQRGATCSATSRPWQMLRLQRVRRCRVRYAEVGADVPQLRRAGPRPTDVVTGETPACRGGTTAGAQGAPVTTPCLRFGCESARLLQFLSRPSFEAEDPAPVTACQTVRRHQAHQLEGGKLAGQTGAKWDCRSGAFHEHASAEVLASLNERDRGAYPKRMSRDVSHRPQHHHWPHSARRPYLRARHSDGRAAC
jgi:hypothetical protein